MNKKRIWLFQIGKVDPLDKTTTLSRTMKIANALIEKNCTVTVWSSLFDHPKKKWIYENEKTIDVNKNLRVKYIKGIGYSKNFSLKRFIDHRVIAKKLLHLVKRETHFPDVVILSMPPYDVADKMICYFNKKRIPTIVDIRDPWPDYFLEPLRGFIRPIVKLLLFFEFQILKRVMRDATSLVSMMESLLLWGHSKAPRTNTALDKVFRLGYQREIEFSKKNRVSELRKSLLGKKIVTFIGVVSHFNNPLIMLKAAKSFQNSNIVYIVGGDGDELKKLKEYAALHELENVLFLGWVDKSEIETLLDMSHIGVCSSNRIEESFPNKVFMYSSAGLPIISCIKGELGDFIEKNRMGFNYHVNNKEDFYHKLLELVENEELYSQMSNNSRKAFDNELSSKTIYENYANHILNISETSK